MRKYTVVETSAADQPANCFIVLADDQPIGEPSAFGTVYASYPAAKPDRRIGSGEWIVKVSNNHAHEVRFRDEFTILRQLAEKNSFTPRPVYWLKREDDQMPAIAMPYYSQRLGDCIKDWEATQPDWEERVVTLMIDYTQAITALNVGGYVCVDRKPDDLFWEDEQLVVIDWNVVRPITNEDYRRAEISLIGRIWYVLLTGHEPLTLNAFNDAQWQRFRGVGELAETETTDAGHISIGLRLLLARLFNGYYQQIDDVRAALITWQTERRRLLAAALQPGRISRIPTDDDIGQLAQKLKIGERPAKIISIDLTWRADGMDESYQQRQEWLAEYLQYPDELEEIRQSLTTVHNTIRNKDYDGAQRILENQLIENDLQRAAVLRWQTLLAALRSKTLDRRSRENLRQLAAKFCAGIELLQRRPEDDESPDLLQQVSVDYAVPLQWLPEGDARKNILAIHHEATLRGKLLQAREARTQRDQRAYWQALREADALRQELPQAYATLVLAGYPLAERLAEVELVEHAQDEVGRWVSRVREDLLHAVQQPGDELNFSAADDGIRNARMNLKQLGNDYLAEFNYGIRHYQALMRFLADLPENDHIGEIIRQGDNLKTALPEFADPLTERIQAALREEIQRSAGELESEADIERVIQRANRLSKELPPAVLPTFAEQITPVVTGKIRAVLNFQQATLDTGDSESVAKAIYFSEILARNSIDSYLDPDKQLEETQFAQQLLQHKNFYDWLADAHNREHHLTIIEKAKAAGVPLSSKALQPYIERSIDDSAKQYGRIEQEFTDYRTEIDGKVAAGFAQQQENMTAFRVEQQQIGQRIDELGTKVDQSAQKLGEYIDAEGEQVAELSGRVDKADQVTRQLAKTQRRNQFLLYGGLGFLFLLLLLAAALTQSGKGDTALQDELTRVAEQNSAAATVTIAAATEYQATLQGQLQGLDDRIGDLENNATQTAIAQPSLDAEATRSAFQSQAAETHQAALALTIAAQVTPSTAPSDPSAETTLATAPSPAETATEMPPSTSVLQNAATLPLIPLANAEMAALQTLKAAIPIAENDYVLHFTAANSNELRTALQAESASALTATLDLIAPIFDAQGERVDFYLVAQERLPEIYVALVLIVTENMELTGEELTPGTVIAFDQNGARLLFRPFIVTTPDFASMTMFLPVTQPVLEQLNTALGVRRQYVVLPQPGSVVVAQIGANNQLLGLLGEPAIPFLTSEARSSAGIVRAEPSTTSENIEQISNTEYRRVILPNDPLGSETIAAGRFLPDGLVNENRIAVEGDMVNEINIWYLVQTAAGRLGWVHGFSARFTGALPDAPIITPLPMFDTSASVG